MPEAVSHVISPKTHRTPDMIAIFVKVFQNNRRIPILTNVVVARTHKMMSRGSAGFSDFVQIAIWPKRGRREMRYGRTGRAGARVRERAKRTKNSI